LPQIQSAAELRGLWGPLAPLFSLPFFFFAAFFMFHPEIILIRKRSSDNKEKPFLVFPQTWNQHFFKINK
jgi:hypothetical protein